MYVVIYVYARVIIIICLLLDRSSVIHLIALSHYLTLLIVMLRFVVGTIMCLLTRNVLHRRFIEVYCHSIIKSCIKELVV